MKFVLPLLVAQCSAVITVSEEKLTNFSTDFSLSASGIQAYPVNYQIQGKGFMQLDLFEEQLVLSAKGEVTGHVDCSKECHYERHYYGENATQFGNATHDVWKEHCWYRNGMCGNPILKAALDVPHKGTSDLFVDGTAGIFGVRGYQAGTTGTEGEFGFAVSFCAVVKLPPRSLPPKSMLQQKFGSERFQKLEDELNRKPHVESDGVATFENRLQGYMTQEFTAKIRTDGADPVSFHYDGFQHQYGGSWLARQVDLQFYGWGKPVGTAASYHFHCPEGASTDLAAHPQARHSLLSLNAMTHAMRQHQDLTFLPEDPAAYFTEQLDAMRDGMRDDGERDDREHDHGQDNMQWIVVVAALAGMSGGGLVVALAKLTNKPRQVPLLSDA